MEAAVRWSPFSAGGRERFLLVDVIDQSVTLNQIRYRGPREANFHSVAKYGRLPNFGAFDWSKTDESIVALGLVSGSACLIKLNEDNTPSETVATFKLKQQRKCNSIALSTENWLAVALDKTRSDVCLNIFDASSGSSSNPEPIRRLCPAEVVSSVRFFPHHPQELVVAAQRSLIRLYDLRDGYFGSGSNSGAQISTRSVNNIAIDPLDENYFASAGSSNDPIVTVWDKRWISQSSSGGGGAVFDFRPAVDDTSPATIWSLRYSGQRRGRLAICSSRGELKVVDMVEGPMSTVSAPENPQGGLSWTHNRYVSQTRTVQRPFDDNPEVDGNAKLIAFDWISEYSQMFEQNLLVLRPNRKVEVLRVPFAVTHAGVTPRHDLSIAFNDLSVLEPKAPMEAYTSHTQPYEQTRTAEDFGPHEYDGEKVDGEPEDTKIICNRESPQLSGMLAASTIQRDRCRRGYLFDCPRNMAIVSGNWQLERLWEIIGRFHTQAANGGMISNATQLDLSWTGVAAICLEKLGRGHKRALSPFSGRIEEAIADLAATRELPPFSGERTDFGDHRQLCLEMCGWRYSLDSLEAECQELIERGLYYQAVVQAVLHDYKHVALNLLRSLIRSKTVPNIGLGALLASDTINKEQREMCHWMATDTDDPALKALLTFLTTGNWRDVMKTNYLHLGYRVALGLKYLNDTELSDFIQTETARAVKNGDLEGILLTGLGEQAMDLFQTYVTKTNDLQTAVLATGFSNPLYVDDMRWDMWKETYFMQMQSWRAFVERSQFIVQHSHMARSKDGRSLLDAPSGSVTLRCNYCQLSLARHDGTSASVRRQAMAKGSVFISAGAGIVCPRCGRHMPRCGICKMWLGTPDPNRRGGAKELQKLNDVVAKFVLFCTSCEHGFHGDHARAWFKKHDTCPVPDCRCLCTVR